MQIILIPSELQMYTDLYHLKISPRIFGLMLFSLAVNVKVKVLCGDYTQHSKNNYHTALLQILWNL